MIKDYTYGASIDALIFECVASYGQKDHDFLVHQAARDMSRDWVEVLIRQAAVNELNRRKELDS